MSQTNAEVPRTLLFEDVLPKTGWGLYYKFMVGMACATSFMHGSAFLSLPFSIPLSTCEHAVTQKILLTLHTGFCLGRSIGGLVLNSLSDVYGRKRFLSYSLAIIFLSSFTAAFAYNYYVITFSAFILASGLESNFCVLRIHLAEILPKNRRGYYLALCDVFWTLGYISLSIFAILMKTPSVIETRAMDMRLTTWRMIFAICGGLSIILACTTALLEESPRYFLHVKKHYLALLTLKQFYAINRSSYGETFDVSVKEADLRNIVQDDLSVYPEPEGFVNIFERVATLIFKSARSLIAGPFLASTAILLIVKTSLTMLGPLEVNIWLAKRLETNSTVLEGIDFVYLDGMRNLSMCNLLEENRTLYYLYFALASNYLLGKIFVMLSIDTCGRRVNCDLIALDLMNIMILFSNN
ncbi:hypothetical protein NQ318_012390 [Aromia moschata]|uniref:Major facilitator superfamily (MFS) profile domain-containing protein n=1 Tax=Aromia moschata TaxID=1265417 RepID=A0AAV8Y2K9_9CUCU|nr:hypothetical protein NQ318_012390 [Aromia moschata]